jgi:REP element-mobilizing transposase RayT
MSRPLRIQYPNAWYHILNYGCLEKVVFPTNKDYQAFLALLQECVGMWGVRISAYILAPDHYQLLVQTPDANLSRFMRHLNGIYTQRYNRFYSKDGQLFRGRYKAILIDEEYLLEVARYIHRTPLRLKITESLESYPWSSHLGLLSISPQWKWLYKEAILLKFSTKVGEAKKEYQRYVLRKESDDVSKFYAKTSMPPFLGSEDFKRFVIEEGHVKGGFHTDIPGLRRFAPLPADIKEAVRKTYRTDSQTFQRSRRGQNNPARNVAVYLTRQLTGLSLTEIGKEFNLLNYSSVSSIIGRVKIQLSIDKELSGKIEKIESKLKMSQEQT